jgi:hypothetical protein
MAAAKQRDHRFLDSVSLADYDFLYVMYDAFDQGVGVIQINRRRK